MMCFTLPCFAVQCYVLLCNGMVWYAMLFHAMVLNNVLLSCAMFVLCYGRIPCTAIVSARVCLTFKGFIRLET